jgi:amidase/aspartyl-tRNA(Asn)/glutamyl-tRNA(Gln) amidotransferase subunit A
VHGREGIVTDELTWAPAWQLRDRIAKGEVSPVEVLDHFLGRIEQHDPVLKAFRHVDREGAHEAARRAEAAVRRGDELGSLHGIPISVKEHIAVAGMPVLVPGAGGPDRIARNDDLGVSRLRAAGAIIVGTNTMMGTQAPAPGEYNWDAEARNPWDPTRAPGWSSSGGAAAASARLLPIAIGSDGGGSTRLPGAYSGVIGVHPSAGLVPSFNYSVKMRRNPTGTIGPLARDSVDAAITMQAMAGPDGRDFDCIQADAPDMVSHLDAGIEGMRLAWTDDYGFTGMYAFDESARVIAAVRQAAQGFRTLGATVETTDEHWEDFFPGLGGTMFLFAPPSIASPMPETAQWINGIDLRDRNWRRCREVLRTHDLLISATTQLLAPTIEDWAARWAGNGPVAFPHGTFAPHYTSHTHLFNWLGFPAVSVPAGFVDGLPIGLQIVGWPGREDKILRAAHAFLEAFPRDEHPPVS